MKEKIASLLEQLQSEPPTAHRGVLQALLEQALLRAELHEADKAAAAPAANN
jgi:hypothetical protein